MSKIGLFYGSETGNTADAAEKIQEEFGGDGVVEIFDISDCDTSSFDAYDCLIIGCPTWNIGEIQSDWDGRYGELDDADFSGKKVAYFGTGDQVGYGDNFQDAMGLLEKKITEKGGTTVGNWPKDDSYEKMMSSKAFLKTPKGEPKIFVGLALDEDNQSDLTDERIQKWVALVKGEFGV